MWCIFFPRPAVNSQTIWGPRFYVYYISYILPRQAVSSPTVWGPRFGILTHGLLRPMMQYCSMAAIWTVMFRCVRENQCLKIIIFDWRVPQTGVCISATYSFFLNRPWTTTWTTQGSRAFSIGRWPIGEIRTSSQLTENFATPQQTLSRFWREWRPCQSPRWWLGWCPIVRQAQSGRNTCGSFITLFRSTSLGGAEICKCVQAEEPTTAKVSSRKNTCSTLPSRTQSVPIMWQKSFSLH